MFNKPFSFEGRIRRSEYGLSYCLTLVLTYVAYFMCGAMALGNPGTEQTFLAIYLIACAIIHWFCYAQGAKRCHDMGRSGWWQLIPFYFLWMLFQDGDSNTNMYGASPKYPPTGEIHSIGGYRGDAPSKGRMGCGRETQPMNSKTILHENDKRALTAILKHSNGQSYNLRLGTNTIGRADSTSNASVQIYTDDRYMSRNHAVIDVENSGANLRCSLRFGYNTQVSIQVNGISLRTYDVVVLNSGDTISLGHTDMKFMIINSC